MASELVWSLLGCRPRVSSSWEPDKPGIQELGTRQARDPGTIPAVHPELGTRQARDSGHAHLQVTNLGTILAVHPELGTRQAWDQGMPTSR